jgi:L-fuculose-phosphate aldolase
MMNQEFPRRRQLIDACLQLAERGFLAATGGNLALRLDEHYFAVTPSATDYYALAPDNIAVLRLQDLEQVAGNLPPSVESGLHAAMLRAKPAMQASVHTHQPLASAVALLDISLPLVEAADIAALGREVTIVGYAPSGTGMLVRALQRRLRPDVHAYLLRNHGLICAAPNLADAVHGVARIESAAAGFLQRHAARLPHGSSLRRLALAALCSTESS